MAIYLVETIVRNLDEEFRRTFKAMNDEVARCNHVLKERRDKTEFQTAKRPIHPIKRA